MRWIWVGQIAHLQKSIELCNKLVVALSVSIRVVESICFLRNYKLTARVQVLISAECHVVDLCFMDINFLSLWHKCV